MLSKLTEASFAISAVQQMSKHNHLPMMSREDKEQATAAVFSEMNKWSAENLPMGASADVSEATINRGLHAVSNKFRNDPALVQAYGFVDPVTILSVISALFSIVGWIVKWWKGES